MANLAIAASDRGAHEQLFLRGIAKANDGKVSVAAKRIDHQGFRSEGPAVEYCVRGPFRFADRDYELFLQDPGIGRNSKLSRTATLRLARAPPDLSEPLQHRSIVIVLAKLHETNQIHPQEP
jgi:hypothetical protein